MYVSQRFGFLESLFIWHCPKELPSSIPRNSQLPPPIKVSLSILESSCGELPFAHHPNPTAFGLYK
jgi:hypothetical protein